MKFSKYKIIKPIKKNIEIVFLFLLILITIISTTYYNNHKLLINKNYTDLINISTFKKALTKF